MKRLLAQIAVIFGILILVLPLTTVQADTGPKPTMEFTFEFQGQPIAIIGGEQLQCDDPTCSDGKPLQVGGPQRFYCTADSCQSLAYGYKPYHKLIIQFADGTRESNVFQKRAFSAVYIVKVTESGLEVEETYANVNVLPSLLITLVIETFVAAVYLAIIRLQRTALKWVPVASLITLPLVWFFILRSSLPTVTAIVLAEAFAVVFEAIFLYGLNRNTLPLKHAVIMSLIMNAASFLIPLFLTILIPVPFLPF
ncbi:MAG: hypothetical protein KF726_08205 [Anaerolineae bacterium]|nr:hypothetical protein [Anaerolineae bacterium]